MAGSLNKVLLIGRIGRDPEMRYTPSGQPVANFSMATDESYTGKDGQKVEKTEWHRVVIWGKQAEFVGNYLGKGRLIYIEGKLETRKWTDKDGAEKYTTEIKADKIVALDPKPEGQQSAGNTAGAPAHAGGNYEDDLGPAFPSEASGLDDAPF